MAQKIQTMLIDDIDGSEAEGTVSFGLAGMHYEIDLNADHARELRTALGPYVEAGRKISRSTRRAEPNGRMMPASAISNTQVRSWARANGLEVKDRGRIPADIVAQYQMATSQ